MVFQVKIEEHRKKMIPKTLFLKLALFNRFWESLGRVLASWATFWRLFLVLVFGMLSRSGLGDPWAGFWLHFQGFGKSLGRILRRFGEGLERLKLQFSWTAFFDFVFWLLVLLAGFGSNTRCLKIA